MGTVNKDKYFLVNVYNLEEKIRWINRKYYVDYTLHFWVIQDSH